jgi:tripartite-type tricarboxylate transporter receptor subunit TctC
VKSISKKLIKCTQLIFGLSIGFANMATAQEYPNKPIRIIVPFSAGGGTDVVARALADRATTKLKQSVLVENKPGANTMIAADFVARSSKDGYTLLFTINSHVLSTLIYQKPTYQLKEFAPISNVVNNYLVLFTSKASLGDGTGSEVIARMRNRQITYGSFGVGSFAHLYGEQMQKTGNFNMLHVPYKGESDAVTGLLSAQIDATFLGPQASNRMQADKAKILGAASPTRLETLPDVPTLAEIGLPGLDRGTFLGLLAPAGTPVDVIKTWEKTIKEIVAEPEFRQRMKSAYMVPVGSTSEEFSKTLDDDLKYWGPLIKSLKLTLD